METSSPSSPTDVETSTLNSPLLNLPRRETWSFCLSPPLDWPMSMPTRAPSMPESFSTSISQVSLNCAKTSTLDEGLDDSVRLTRVMTLDTLGCSTLVVCSIALTPSYSGRLTIACAALPPFSCAASASRRSRYLLSTVVPSDSTLLIASRSWMQVLFTVSPLNTTPLFSPCPILACSSLPTFRRYVFDGVTFL